MRTFINHANDILGDPTNKKNVKRAIEKLADVSTEATARLRDANDTLVRLNRTLDSVWSAVEGAKPTVAAVGKFFETGTKTLEDTAPKAQDLITSLTKTSEQLGKSLSDARLILAKINSGEGSAGRFVNDAKLYETLVENTEQVELLLKEIKAFVSRAREKGVPIKLK
jgi:ABC-type transporter Mla subunit MlaD